MKTYNKLNVMLALLGGTFFGADVYACNVAATGNCITNIANNYRNLALSGQLNCNVFTDGTLTNAYLKCVTDNCADGFSPYFTKNHYSQLYFAAELAYKGLEGAHSMHHCNGIVWNDVYGAGAWAHE